MTGSRPGQRKDYDFKNNSCTRVVITEANDLMLRTERMKQTQEEKIVKVCENYSASRIKAILGTSRDTIR